MRSLTALIPGLALLVFACTKPNPPSNSFPSPGDVPVAIAVDLSKPGVQIPERFTGLSFETQALHNGTWFDISNTSFINLVKGLGKGVVRVGGASGDHFTWGVGSVSSFFCLVFFRFFAFVGCFGWFVLF